MIPLCRAEGLGVIPWSPLARGHLARSPDAYLDRSTTRRAEHDSYGHKLYDGPGDVDIITAVATIAGERGVTPAEVSLAWLLSRPAVAAPIIGATRLEHLDAAIRAVDLILTDDEIQRLEAPYRPHRVMGH